MNQEAQKRQKQLSLTADVIAGAARSFYSGGSCSILELLDRAPWEDIELCSKDKLTLRELLPMIEECFDKESILADFWVLYSEDKRVKDGSYIRQRSDGKWALGKTTNGEISEEEQIVDKDARAAALFALSESISIYERKMAASPKSIQEGEVSGSRYQTRTL